MKEVKFRAWDSEANIMVYSDHRTRKLYDVYYGFEMNENGLLECRWEGDFSESHVLDGGTLGNIMQFTGLKDKNGVEIYEGDIDKGGYVVTYVDGSDESDIGMNVGFYIQRNDFESWTQLEVGAYYEVIGNIHDNPELIEVNQ